MSIRDLVIRSQLIPPQAGRKGLLPRPRLLERLQAVFNYPVVLVQAGTGYGKSTLLAELAGKVKNFYWYTITEPDRDPLLFLAHLLSAFNQGGNNLGETALRALEESGGRVSMAALTPLINSLTIWLDGPAVLVLDDYHLVMDVPEIAGLVERLVDYRPPNFCLVLATRQIPSTPAVKRWKVKGQMHIIQSADLAFTVEEIEALFREYYAVPIRHEQAERLVEETGGWAIALQMLWQSLQSGLASGLEDALDHSPDTLEDLFDYLANDVLARQPQAVQNFLLTTAVLRQMSAPACDALTGGGSAALLAGLYETGFFTEQVGDGTYRYQRLFHDFLHAQLQRDPARAQALHLRAAAYFDGHHPEECVYHLLQAGDYSSVAEWIERLGPGLLEIGRFDSLLGWLAPLPDSTWHSHPTLYLVRGDILRLKNDFEGALEQYQQASELFLSQNDRLGRARALRGQAQVYLDTIRPMKADTLLEEALRLLEPQEYRHETAAILDQLAENRLNLGRPEQAETLHHEAILLRAESDPGDLYLEARSLLRTGRLAEARKILEVRAAQERLFSGNRPQRFHRETSLLLSLIASLQGDVATAEAAAREGIAIGARLNSEFVEAVGYMRLGHPLQMGNDQPWGEGMCRAAIPMYEQAIEKSRPFGVMRVHVEPLWGLTRTTGYCGDLISARQYAEQGLEIARQAGDIWMGNLVRSALGSALVQAGEVDEARSILEEAAGQFIRVGDSFGWTAVQMWQSLNAWRTGDLDAAMQYVAALLPVARQNNYQDLFTRPSLLGLRDGQAFWPILLEARRREIEPGYIHNLLHEVGLEDLDSHPGYTLWVRMFGPFTAWRGADPVRPAEWQREKARQLFQLLLIHRGKWLGRDQICDLLWPDAPGDTAVRDFKVALSTMNKALDPDRPQGSPSFFVLRRENYYMVNPQAQIRLDVDDFERLSAAEKPDLLRKALALAADKYLSDSINEEWALAERERLERTWLAAADRLAVLLAADGKREDAIQISQTILRRDPTHENAYRLLMEIHGELGNRPQVQNIYNRYATALRENLGIEPSGDMQMLLARLVHH